VDADGCPTAPAPAEVDSQPAQRIFLVPGEAWPLRKADLSPIALPVLDSVVSALQADPLASAEVSGYAQDRLVPSDNTRLSQRRAEVVRNYFISKGIGVSRVTAIGRGSQVLLVADTSETARTTNRRVEIRVTRNP
jgi:outer membrane protein OmpA-like peptidoglycan-associated protein